MNQRIRELADQAELTIRTSTGTYMSHPEFNKKFAELIVQECIGMSDNNALTNARIRKHFGIEECS